MIDKNYHKQNIDRFYRSIMQLCGNRWGIWFRTAVHRLTHELFRILYRGKEKLFLAIEVSSKENLIWMMKGVTNTHIYISSNTFHINTLYKPTDRFPAARIYFIKSEDHFGSATLVLISNNTGLNQRQWMTPASRSSLMMQGMHNVISRGTRKGKPTLDYLMVYS